MCKLLSYFDFCSGFITKNKFRKNIFPEFIFGYESGTKVKIAEELTQTYEILGFIEDRKKTLIDIKQNSETSHIPCFLADWGYLKKSDKYTLNNEIKLLKLGNLEELVAI